MRLREFDRDDGGEAFAAVLSGEAAFDALEHIVLLGVVVEDAGERRSETDEVRAALRGVDVVGEREDGLVEGVRPL